MKIFPVIVKRVIQAVIYATPLLPALFFRTVASFGQIFSVNAGVKINQFTLFLTDNLRSAFSINITSLMGMIGVVIIYAGVLLQIILSMLVGVIKSGFVILGAIITVLVGTIKSGITITYIFNFMSRVLLNIEIAFNNVIQTITIKQDDIGFSPLIKFNSLQIPKDPALEVVQISYNLTHRKGADVVTQINNTCGRQDFANPNNALGLHNGSVSQMDGNLLAARCGILLIDYDNFFNKTLLTVDQVLLHFYYSLTTLLSATSVGGYILTGSSLFTLFSDPALTNQNFLTTPRTFDITTNVKNWATTNSQNDWWALDGLQARLAGNINGLALNDHVALDAIEIEVLASAVQNL